VALNGDILEMPSAAVSGRQQAKSTPGVASHNVAATERITAETFPPISELKCGLDAGPCSAS
jgi:hypothetical protein